jgi:nucleoside 2-deoxyribosyltransferase
MKRVYIAGPMTGYPEHNFPAFDAAKEQLATEGVIVVSPADITRAHVTDGISSDGTITPEAYSFYVRLDILMLLECDEVVLLEGWFTSRGSRLEIAIAQACGIPVFLFSTRKPLEIKIQL